jgi:hypothetical protein
MDSCTGPMIQVLNGLKPVGQSLSGGTLMSSGTSESNAYDTGVQAGVGKLKKICGAGQQLKTIPNILQYM